MSHTDGRLTSPGQDPGELCRHKWAGPSTKALTGEFHIEPMLDPLPRLWPETSGMALCTARGQVRANLTQISPPPKGFPPARTLD